MVVQPGLCGTWSETLKTGFLTTRLIYCRLLYKFVENERNVKGNDKITVTYFVSGLSKPDETGEQVRLRINSEQTEEIGIVSALQSLALHQLGPCSFPVVNIQKL